MAHGLRGIGLTALLLALSTAGLAISASAQDPTRGKLLYENHCTSCHTSRVHVRETHKAKSTQEIRQFVLRWRSELELDWGEADVDDVTDYLNRTYYDYPPGS